MTPEEFRQAWVETFNLGGPDEATILFTRADVRHDGVIDALDIPHIFAFFDENGTFHSKAEIFTFIVLSLYIFRIELLLTT